MSAIHEPVELNDTQVLDQLNAVRKRMGWEPLSKIPTGDPTDGCRCVLGRSWCILVDPISVDACPPDPRWLAHDDGYQSVTLFSRTDGPNGSLLEALADVLDGSLSTGEYPRDQHRDADCVIVDGGHPLMRWMWRFDHQELPGLIDHYVIDPLHDDYTEDFTA